MGAEYPGKVTTQLKSAINNLSLTLTDDVGENVDEIFVVATAGAPASGSFHIENEIIFYPEKTSIKFGPGLTRGADGTTKAVHLKTLLGGEVIFGPEAHFINNLNDEVIATQTKLGITGAFNFVAKTGAESIAGVKTLADTPKVDHIAELTGAHGIEIDGITLKDDLDTSGIVGKTTAQTLTNKTLTSPLFTGTIDGWIASASWSYASANTITVPSGAAAIYQKGDKIKFTQTTVKYGVIIAVADTLLTIAVTPDYVVADAAITLPYYSHQANPLGFPVSFTWTPILTGGPADLSGYTSAIFTIQGKVLYYVFAANAKNVTGSAGLIQITLPVAGVSANTTLLMGLYNGSAQDHACVSLEPASAVLNVYKTVAAGSWVGNETGVNLQISGFYTI